MISENHLHGDFLMILEIFDLFLKALYNRFLQSRIESSLDSDVILPSLLTFIEEAVACSSSSRGSTRLMVFGIKVGNASSIGVSVTFNAN